jgi:DNA-binding NtrC family response regulator
VTSRGQKRPVVTRAPPAGPAGSRLRPSDRDYLGLVSEAAFANPFSVQRSRLDEGLVEAPVIASSDDSAWTQRMLDKLGTKLRHVRSAGALQSEHDRVLVENAVCFEAFHRFLDDMNDYIEAQQAAPAALLRLGFATSLLHHLTSRGISAERAQRIFELFYQMARAYYFISRGLVGGSESMRRLREALWDAIFTHDILRYEHTLWNRMEDFSTILVGETGTGKGAAAAAIGRSGFIAFEEKKSCFGHTPDSGFVAINLNEFSETLFESEIFGHRKGSFTGAFDNHRGVLARCPAYGSVFFDEIGEATLPIQVKLLRVLQERVYTPVGSREPERFGGRILAATNRPLSELRAQGAMRDDFYYRLCANVIEVPPLRLRIAEHPAELRILVEHLCTRIAGRDARALAEEVSAKLHRDLGDDYTFPGNVRELEQCVRRVLLTGSCQPDQAGPPGSDRALAAELFAGALSAEQLVARYCAVLYARLGSYVEVARLTGLDRRTVKKHLEAGARG